MIRVLYIYRNSKMGISIGKVFQSIEREMKKYCEVESIYLPADNYKPLGIYKNVRFLKRYLKGKEFDLIHITGTEHYLLPFLRKYNTIITVHDLGFLTYLRLSPFRRLWKKILWIKTLRYARKVIFISNKSLKEVEAFTGEDARYNVIYNPVDKTFQFKGKKPNLKCPTILHIGTKPNKNLKACIIALKNFNCKLRIIGRLTDSQKYLLKNSGIKYSNAYNLTDQEIIDEYYHCDIVSFVSLYEGFGMPIIEGQSIGRVVVTSDIPPMNEVASNSAVLVNPYDIESIKRGYEIALSKYGYYEKLGLENVKRFNLDNITRQYYSLYKNLLCKKEKN